jgi:hypothetical protein
VDNHGGSRKRLLFTRGEKTRTDLQTKMATMTFKNQIPTAVNTRRVNMITNLNFENQIYKTDLYADK